MTNISSPQPPTADHRKSLLAAYDLAAAVVAAVQPDQLTAATPCPEIDVAGLVEHLVGAGWRAVEVGRGQKATGKEFPHVSLVDAQGQLRTAGAEAAEAWTDGRLSVTIKMPWGETYSGLTLIDMYLCELVAHAWDLSVATGQTLLFEEDLALDALTAAHSMLRPDYRDMMGTGNPFGREQPVESDATTLERFVAFMGRSPAWRP